MPTYNGHPSWEHWNVCLWIDNDEGLYQLAKDCAQRNWNITAAASDFIQSVRPARRTPDGAPYTLPLVEYALQHFFNEEN